MADHPTGPDDEVTPVDGPSRDVNWPVPSGPRAGPRPAFGQPRDSQPPRPAPSPVPTTKPAWVEAPKHDLSEPKSGVFHVVTGHTRGMVKWGAVLTLLNQLLHPVTQAVAERINPPPERELLRALLKDHQEKPR